MANNYVSAKSLEDIELARADFVKDFREVIISDTVKKILLASTPIEYNEDKQESEIQNEAHAEELNDMVGKAARDLTRDAIKGNIIKTNFNEYEQPSNYLDAVSQASESYIVKESNQRANWFKLMIEKGKIPDSSVNYVEFTKRLGLLFQKKNFSVEDYEYLHNSQIEAAKSFEEEDIINQIKEGVTEEVQQSEIRQNHILDVMQEVHDTKNEYAKEREAEAEENDPDTAQLEDSSDKADQDASLDNLLGGGDAGESGESSDGKTRASGMAHDGSSSTLFKMKPKQNEADKLADKIKKKKRALGREEYEDENQSIPEDGESIVTSKGDSDNGPDPLNIIDLNNQDDVDKVSNNESTELDSNGNDEGQNGEASGGLATYQNRDNFGGDNAVGIGGYENQNYNGPETDLGSGVLDSDTSQIDDDNNDNTSNDDQSDTNPIDGVENSNTQIEDTEDGPKVKFGPGDEENPTGEQTINPLRGAEEDPSKDKTESEIVNKNPSDSEEALIINTLVPMSLYKFGKVPIYSKESIARHMFKLGEKAEYFQKSIEDRLFQLSFLVKESDNPFYSKKFDLVKETYKKGFEEYIILSRKMMDIGLTSTEVVSKENMFAISVAKNILNRYVLGPKGRKYMRILKKEDKYRNSVEYLVDTMFTYYSFYNKLHKAKSIETAMAGLADIEEKINGAIYNLNDEDKRRANVLKDVLGSGKIDKLFVMDNLLLDYNNIFYRVKETKEKPVNLLLEREFTEKVLEKLENKGLDINESLESMVVDIITGRKDPTMENLDTFSSILLTLSHKAMKENNSMEALNDKKTLSKLYTKAKVYLTIKRSAECLGLNTPEFEKAFKKAFIDPIQLNSLELNK